MAENHSNGQSPLPIVITDELAAAITRQMERTGLVSPHAVIQLALESLEREQTDQAAGTVCDQVGRDVNYPRRETVLGGDVTVDLDRKRLKRRGDILPLTPIEFAILAFLLRARRPVGRDELLQELWGRDFDPHTNSVAVHISRLRRKLGPGVLETAPTGYCLFEAA